MTAYNYLILNKLSINFRNFSIQSTTEAWNVVSDGRTDKQTEYCNPRCACAPRVNDDDDKINYLYRSFVDFNQNKYQIKAIIS